MDKPKIIVFTLSLLMIISAAVFFVINHNYAISSLLLILALISAFFIYFEIKKYPPSVFVPIAVMCSIAVIGRVLFAPFPNFKPCSAIIIIAGCAFGPMSGFMTGSLTALVSNMFFGQGPWTLWQMFAFGVMGIIAGLVYKTGILKSRVVISVFGFLCAMLYGLILNIYHILFYVEPSFPAIIAAIIASLPFDLAHCISTSVFLLFLASGWIKKLERICKKFL